MFWPDSVSIRDFALFVSATIQGHNQLTDIYLLALAVANHGALATFDRSIPIAAVAGAGDNHVSLL